MWQKLIFPKKKKSQFGVLFKTNETKKEIGTVPPGGCRNTIRTHMSDFENKSLWNYYLQHLPSWSYKDTCGFALSHVQLSETLWSVAFQAPLSMGFSRQESWSGLPFPSPGDLPSLGIEPSSPTSSALAGHSFTMEPPGK